MRLPPNPLAFGLLSLFLVAGAHVQAVPSTIVASTLSSSVVKVAGVGALADQKSVNSTGLPPGSPSLPPTDGCAKHPGGGKCPESAPCCNNGYCSNNPVYCSTGCDAKNSFGAKSCFPEAYCSNVHEEFNNPRLADMNTYNGNPTTYDFTTDYNPTNVKVQNSQLSISMKQDKVLNGFGRPQGLGSVVSTTRFMQYGTVSVRMKTGSSGPGVVSAFIIRNEQPGDEIDFEMVGKNPKEAQTNYYYRTPPEMDPNLIDYDNAGSTPLPFNSATDFHVYSIDWKPDHIFWSVDGQVIRSLYRNQTDVDPDTDVKKVGVDGAKKFPSTPARIQLGIWDGGQGSNGTASWAGSPTDWSTPDKEYAIVIDYIDIQCYYPGNASLTWPPEGYGPTPVSEGTPYITPGLDGRPWAEDDSSLNAGSPPPDHLRPFVPFYRNPKLMIPTGIVLAAVIGVVGVIEIVRRRQAAMVKWQ